MAKNDKTRFFYVLYSDKTRVFDQSERAYYHIYIIKKYICMYVCWLACMQYSNGPQTVPAKSNFLSELMPLYL